MKLILAVDSKGGIGKNNSMPWSFIDFKEDITNFRKVTTNHTVIMGSETFKSMDYKPLKNRHNIVLSRYPEQFQYIEHDNLSFVKIQGSIVETLQSQHLDPNSFIIGGANIANQAMPLVNEIHLTSIHHDFECDAFATRVLIGLSDFRLVERKPYLINRDIPFTIDVYRRKGY